MLILPHAIDFYIVIVISRTHPDFLIVFGKCPRPHNVPDPRGSLAIDLDNRVRNVVLGKTKVNGIYIYPNDICLNTTQASFIRTPYLCRRSNRLLRHRAKNIWVFRLLNYGAIEATSA